MLERIKEVFFDANGIEILFDVNSNINQTKKMHRKKSACGAVKKSSKNNFRSSSTVPIPAMPKFSTSTFATFGDKKAGRGRSQVDIFHAEV